MIKYLLIFTLYNPTGDGPVAFVMGEFVSGSECIAMMESFSDLEKDIGDARFSCEVDSAAKEST